MRTQSPLVLIILLLPSFLATLSAAQGFDFFYFVLQVGDSLGFLDMVSGFIIWPMVWLNSLCWIVNMQWPGSYCDTKRSCCYPSTGKPAADFGIHGLWPNYKDGSYPSNCDPDSEYNESKVCPLLLHLLVMFMSLCMCMLFNVTQIKVISNKIQTEW